MKKRKKTCRIVPPPRKRADLEREFGRLWTTADLAAEFIVTAIIGNTVVVRRKSDNVVGSLSYQNDPRLYFGFVQAPPTE